MQTYLHKGLFYSYKYILYVYFIQSRLTRTTENGLITRGTSFHHQKPNPNKERIALMNRSTFKLMQEAAHYAERLLKLDPKGWLNRLRNRLHIVVAIKGHHMRPELPGRPSLAAQAVFSFYHQDQIQGEHPFTEGSPEFRSLTEKWGGIFIKNPIKKEKSHQTKEHEDPSNLFTVGASGGKLDENSMAIKAFTKAMNVFLAEFRAELKGVYNETKVLIFSEKMRVRLNRVKIVELPKRTVLKSN